jgi:hypothetical protein
MIKDDERYWANMVIGVIDNLERPMLMYEGEKMIVRKALKAYLEANGNDSEIPNNSTCSKMEQVDKDINVRSKDEPQIIACPINERAEYWFYEDEPQVDGILFKGDLKEGDYKLIKTTDGWVLANEEIVYCGWERSER